MDSKMKKLAAAVTMGLFMTAIYFAGRQTAALVAGRNVQTDKAQSADAGDICVVVDAGHGGMDPGKIGVNDVPEKDINLKIALLVKGYLESNDIRVVMTRETDAGLHDGDASNKKVQDMRHRLEIIEAAAPAVAVSIHQNSYPEEYVHGAQIFYYGGSQEGRLLAEKIQAQFLDKVDPENPRQTKANDSYYLLKKTSVPIVIAECGFLSNWAEAEALNQKAYQEKTAWAITLGVLQYLNTEGL